MHHIICVVVVAQLLKAHDWINLPNTRCRMAFLVLNLAFCNMQRRRKACMMEGMVRQNFCCSCCHTDKTWVEKRNQHVAKDGYLK